MNIFIKNRKNFIPVKKEIYKYYNIYNIYIYFFFDTSIRTYDRQCGMTKKKVVYRKNYIVLTVSSLIGSLILLIQ